MSDLPAGPELDRLVAEKVMGWTVNQHGTFTGKTWASHRAFSPSTDIAHAWEVVEKLRERGIRLAIVQTDDGWLVGRDDDAGYVYKWVVDIRFSVRAECESAPLAICRCALSAIDYDDNFGDTYSEAERS